MAGLVPTTVIFSVAVEVVRVSVSDVLVKTVPKELIHDHLDGGLRVETLIELANEQNYQNLPSTSHDELKKWIQPKPDKSLAINLEAWEHTIGCLLYTSDAADE